MTAELDVTTAKGFLTIALVGVAVVLAIVAAEYIVPKVRTKLGI